MQNILDDTVVTISSKGLHHIKKPHGLHSAMRALPPFLSERSTRPRAILEYLREHSSKGRTVAQIKEDSALFLIGFEVKSGWGDPKTMYGVELAEEATLRALRRLIKDGYINTRCTRVEETD